MNNKRKGRGGASTSRPQRPRSVATEGVYNNVPFMLCATLQLGNIARLRTVSGHVWEGVFRTFSPEFDAVLEAVVKLENPDTPDERALSQTQMQFLIFKMKDVLSISFKNIDMEYATKDSFQTDSAISSRVNGNRTEEKELEPWDAGNMNGNDNVSLDLEMANGWDVQDMFRKNEQEYGVQSTFDHSLRGYTVPLQTSDTPDFREAHAKATQIAQEIENQPAYKARLDMENGDEEAAFAAVVRPTQDNDKYIPPAKRNETNNGKLVGRSPPPVTSTGSTQNLPSPKDTRPPPVSYPVPPHVHQSTHAIQNSLPPAHMPPIQHVMPPPHLPNTMMPPPPMTSVPPPVHSQPMVPMAQQHVPIPPNHANSRSNSHTPPQYQQGPPPRHGIHHSNGPPNHKGQSNGELVMKTNRNHRQQPQQNYVQAPVPTMPPGHPQGPPPQQDCGAHPVPQGMRQQPPVPSVQAQEALKELQMFSKEFNLAPMAHSGPAVSSVPQHLSVQHTQMAPSDGAPAQGVNVGASANSGNVTNAPSNATDQNQATGVSQTEPSPAQSPPSSDSEKLQTAVSKSKLNPNAREFVLSPVTKPFQPRSPSTPSVSRPHTPQTPSHNPYMTAAVNGPGGPSMPVAVLPMPYMTISQPQYQAPPPQANRLRKINMRPEVSHMPHAAAVTGQPLLAPAPIHQFIYNPQAAVHGMNQAAYQPAAVASMHAAAALGRMYDAGAVATTTQRYFQIPYLPPQPNGAPSGGQGTYNPAGVQQQGPPQGSINYQQHYLQAVPQQQPPPQMPTMFCIPTQPHMLPNVPYMQQAPPPGAQHPHVQLLLQHQHPSQGGNPHGPNQ